MHINNMHKVPQAACTVCGGWTSQGGMSQYSDNTMPVYGRTGCDGPHMVTREKYWIEKLNQYLNQPSPVKPFRGLKNKSGALASTAHVNYGVI